MRSLIAVLAATVMMMWAPIKLMADQPAEGPTEGIQDLKLTDEQEGKIQDIRDEYRPKVQEAGKALATVVKEEMDKIRAVLTADQKAKVDALKDDSKERRPERLAERVAHFEDLDLTDADMDKIAAIRKECRPQIEKALEGLKGVLSADQMKARDDGLKAGKKRKEVLASLNLTAEQKEKVEAVAKDLATIVREEMEKIRDVLNDGEKEKLQEVKEERKERVRDRMAFLTANLKDLNLSDDEKSQIAQIRQEYRPKVQEAGNKLRGAVREEVEKIVVIIKG
jgi:Spy/CpxP family protein refolding chaperone